MNKPICRAPCYAANRPERSHPPGARRPGRRAHAAHHSPARHSLEEHAQRLSVQAPGRHTARGDAIVTGELFLRMIAPLEERGIYTLQQARKAAQQTYLARPADQDRKKDNAMPAKILVADDDVMLQRLISNTLKLEHHEIIQAANGQQALETIRGESPDPIILDVMMPIINGFDVCIALRKDAATATLPVIMLSGLGQVQEKIMGLKAGADEYLTKPIDPRGLFDTC